MLQWRLKDGVKWIAILAVYFSVFHAFDGKLGRVSPMEVWWQFLGIVVVFRLLAMWERWGKAGHKGESLRGASEGPREP